MITCLTKAAIAALLASGGTAAVMTAFDSPPAAPAAYTCPAGISDQQCSYLMDLSHAGLPVFPTALAAGLTICANLNHGRGISVEYQAQLFQANHPVLSPAQAESYVAITQTDVCP